VAVIHMAAGVLPGQAAGPYGGGTESRIPARMH